MPQRATILTRRNRTLALSDKGAWLPVASPMPCRRIEVFAEAYMAGCVAETIDGDPITITPVTIDDDGAMTFPAEPTTSRGWLAEYAEVYPEDDR